MTISGLVSLPRMPAIIFERVSLSTMSANANPLFRDPNGDAMPFFEGDTVQSAMKFGVVDLFAGPGGLAEGFSAVTDQNGQFPFEIVLSVEKEESAHSTLLLRTFLRQFGRKYPEEYYTFLRQGTAEPDWPALYPAEWENANREALRLELGPPENEATLSKKIQEIHRKYGNRTILIGGPPCQAYSLVGRARNSGIASYVPEKDPKHTLYKNYIKVLTDLCPAAFVMENVTGMLSSSLNKTYIFDRILHDLQNAGGGYHLLALAPRHGRQSDLFGVKMDPRDFILCAEEFGLPQARHRVIVVGVRQDLAAKLESSAASSLLTPWSAKASVKDVLHGMPKLRSGLSRNDSTDTWIQTMKDAAEVVCKAVAILPAADRALFRQRVNECANPTKRSSKIWPRTAMRPARVSSKCSPSLSNWLLDPHLGVLPNNETRCHMPSDFARYLFAAVYAEIQRVSPKSIDFPESLIPDHRSWDSGGFADRFRVQLWDQPSTTVTSHISKDGHYFIHPDPEQCRSLTVREAARLQTFPDNYLFKGTRTQQFIQVGNAVPPFLAKQIGDAVFLLLKRSIGDFDPTSRGSRAQKTNGELLRAMRSSAMLRSDGNQPRQTHLRGVSSTSAQ
jgi:DNA (cytosine-5)-methyltransferase 1